MAGYSEYSVSAVSGSNTTLRISNLPNNHLSLTLFYNSNQKILEWESDKPNPHFFKTTFKDRVILDRKNGIFYIYKVQKNDTSTYLLKVVMENGTEEEWKIPLEVFGEFEETKGKSPLWGLGWSGGRFPGDEGGSPGRREKPQDRLNSFLLGIFHNSLGVSEPKI